MPDVALAEVEIQILFERALTARVLVAFLPSDAPPVGNLLGTDVLEFFDFGGSHAKRTLYFGLPA